MAEIDPYLAGLYSKVRQLLAWFPITSGSMSSSIYATTAEIADLGPAESAGTSPTVTRGDHIHNLPYATASDIADLGPAESAGTAATVARGDHIHALPWATTGAIADVAGTESAGSGTTVPRGDHVHAIPNNLITAAMLNSTFYNTGTYSPTLAGTSAAGSNTYTAATTGKYWQIGSMMVVIFHLQMASKDGAMAGNLYITMPATMAASLPVSGAFPTLFDSVDFAAGYTQFSYYMSANTNRLMLAQQGDNVAASNVAAAAVTTSTILRGIAVFPV